MPTIDDAIEQLREAIKADLYELPDTDAEPNYDEQHGTVELILSLNDPEEDGKPVADIVHIEMYERYEDGTNADLDVNLTLDEARRVHAALTAILKAANA